MANQINHLHSHLQSHPRPHPHPQPTTSIPAPMPMMSMSLSTTSTSTIEPKIRRSRASKPKVKTGCQTCKIRRVKCDETKPACMRCVRFGHKCDGYTYISKSGGAKPTTLITNILPAPSPRTLGHVSNEGNHGGLVLPISPATSTSPTASVGSGSLRTSPEMGRMGMGTSSSASASCSPPNQRHNQNHASWNTGTDHREGEVLFRNFCREITFSSSGEGNFEVWWGIIFAGCEASSMIFDAVHLIGALDLELALNSGVKDRERERVRDGVRLGNFRHMATWREYRNTKCLVRKRMVRIPIVADGNGNGRGGCRNIDVEMEREYKTTLIASLLTHTSSMREIGVINTDIGSEQELSQMFLGLRTLRDWTVRTLITRGGPHEYEQVGGMSKVTILKAFGKLEMRLLAYADSIYQREQERNGRGSLGNGTGNSPEGDDVELEIVMMPGRFSDLREARIDLEKLVGRSMDWLTSTLRRWDFTYPHSRSNLYPHQKRNSPEENSSETGGLFFDIDPKFEEEKRTLREYERWDRSFSPLFDRSRKSLDDGDEKLHYAQEVNEGPLPYILRMLWLAGYILIASSNHLHSVGLTNGNGSARFSAQLDELREISKRLKVLPNLKEVLGRVGGGFKVRTVLPLMVVGWETRDRILRRLGVDMLLRCKREEVGTPSSNSMIGARFGGDDVLGRVMESLVKMEDSDDEHFWGERRGRETEMKMEREFVSQFHAVKDIEMSFDEIARTAYVKYRKAYEQGFLDAGRIREVIIPW